MRKPISILVMLAYISGYIWLISLIAARIANAHNLAQLFFYAIAGIVWIMPLRRLFAWMNANTPPPD